MTDLPVETRLENLDTLALAIDTERTQLDYALADWLQMGCPVDLEPSVQRLKRLLGLYAAAQMDLEDFVRENCGAVQ